MASLFISVTLTLDTSFYHIIHYYLGTLSMNLNEREEQLGTNSLGQE